MGRDLTYRSCMGNLYPVPARHTLHSTSQVEAEAVFFERGMGRGPGVPLCLGAKRVVAGAAGYVEQRVDLPAELAASIRPETCVAYACRLRLTEGAYYPGTYERRERWLGTAVGLGLVPTREALVAVPTHAVATASAPKHVLLSGQPWPGGDE